MKMYLRIQEAADRSRLSKPTLYRLARAGLIKIRKVGKVSLIDAAELEQAIEDGRFDGRQPSQAA